MWDDVIIGKGEKGISAHRVFEIQGGNHSISENGVSYWIIHESIIKCGLTIFKNTAEGKTLTKMIEQKTPLHKMNSWLDKIILKNIKPKLLLKKINEMKEKSFVDGANSKVNEFRKLLYIQ